MFPAGLEPATLRVVRGSIRAYLWGARDNHYTTETAEDYRWNFTYLKLFVTTVLAQFFLEAGTSYC